MSDVFESDEWDGESYCVRDNCFEPARFQKPWGMADNMPIVEMVCGYHMNEDE